MKELEVRQIMASNIRRLRKQRGLSQLKLANELQMAMTFLNDIENCRKWISPETLAKFASFFKVPLSEFFLSAEEVCKAKSSSGVVDGKIPVPQTLFAETLKSEVDATVSDVLQRFGLISNE